ncbi:MAG: class I SAM-dependent methyltransferase, partial [Bacteroidota bacterium]
MEKRTFSYKEIDLEGEETLKTISEANLFNDWMAATVEKNLIPGNILEIGSGIGNISKYFLEKGWQMSLSDIRENYCGHLQKHFSHYDSLQDIVQLDLVHPEFDSEYADQLGKYDNLYALNVIEHIEDDVLALANCKKLLKPGGRMVILVPAYQSLYNTFDENLFHFRRYTRSTMSKVFEK